MDLFAAPPASRKQAAPRERRLEDEQSADQSISAAA
jgi:hypothetical protein